MEWIPVFFGVEPCDILINALKFCRTHKGLKVRAYVIMENHFHMIAEAPDLSRVIQVFKRHTTSEIIQYAERTKKTWLLNQFAFFKKSHLEKSTHQVWQEGFHPKRIQGPEMRAQKTRYIHENPVRRGFVDQPDHWRYSSARNYLLDDHAVMDIDRDD